LFRKQNAKPSNVIMVCGLKKRS